MLHWGQMTMCGTGVRHRLDSALFRLEPRATLPTPQLPSCGGSGKNAQHTGVVAIVNFLKEIHEKEQHLGKSVVEKQRVDNMVT